MSKLDQMKTRPATHVFTSRADGRYLATLLMFWRGQESPPSSMSELVRLSVETFAEFLITNNMAQFVASHEDAEAVLQATGFAVKRTNPKNVADVLAKESASMAFLETVQPEGLIRQSGPVATPDLDTAQALLKKALDDGLKEKVTQAREDSKEFIKHLGDVSTVEVVDGRNED